MTKTDYIFLCIDLLWLFYFSYCMIVFRKHYDPNKHYNLMLFWFPWKRSEKINIKDLSKLHYKDITNRRKKK